MNKEHFPGDKSCLASAHNFNKIDFTEFVKKLGREYGESVYEATETMEDLQCTIYWADVNFYESDSLNWVLNDDSDYEEIAKVFDDMEWEEYKGYEHIFVEAAKERMEECLEDWKCNHASDIVAEYEEKIDTETKDLFESVKCYGIESYDEIDQIDDLETKQYVLERTKDALYNVKWLVNDMYDSLEEVYNCTCMGPEDGFTAQLTIMRFFGFSQSECDSDNMCSCMDYIEEKYSEIYDMLDEVEYEIQNQVTVSA